MPAEPTPLALPSIALAGVADEAAAAVEDQVGALALLGWPEIELRTVDGVALAELDEAAFARVARAVEAAGLRVACVDSQVANWSRPITGNLEDDMRELDVLARRCPALGVRYVRVMSYPNDGLSEAEWGRRAVERMRALTERAERAGLVLLHENCAGWAGASAARTLEMLDAVASPALRLLFDSGNGVAYGYDACDLLREVAGWVAHVHVKDADGEASSPVYTFPGEGRCRVADCLRLLLAAGFQGTWSIEPHLRVQPHAGHLSAGADGVALFVEYGRRLERLVRDAVLPAAAGAGDAPWAR